MPIHSDAATGQGNDRVRTRAQPIRWIGAHKGTAHYLICTPDDKKQSGEPAARSKGEPSASPLLGAAGSPEETVGGCHASAGLSPDLDDV